MSVVPDKDNKLTKKVSEVVKQKKQNIEQVKTLTSKENIKQSKKAQIHGNQNSEEPIKVSDKSVNDIKSKKQLKTLKTLKNLKKNQVTKQNMIQIQQQLKTQNKQILRQLKEIDKEEKLIKKNLVKKKAISKKQRIQTQQTYKDKDQHRQKSHQKNDISLMALQNNKNQSQNVSPQPRPIKKRQKLVITQQDIQKLKKLKQQHRERQKRIKLKVVAHQDLLKNMKTQQILSKQKKIKNQLQKRVEEVKKRQKSLDKERQEKLKRYEEQNKKLVQLKHKKKLHQKMQDNFHHKIEEKELQKSSLLKSRIQQKVVNFDSIKQHQASYSHKRTESIQTRNQNLKHKIKKLQEQFNNLGIHKSVFYDRIKDEKQVRQKQLEQNNEKVKVLSEKKKEYWNIVKKQHKPQVRELPPIEQKKIHPYDYDGTRNLGNEYMKSAAKNVNANVSRKQKRLTLDNKSQLVQIKKAKYKDYLQESRLNKADHQKQNKQAGHTQKKNKLQLQMNQLCKTQDPAERSHKVKILQQKIQSHGYPNQKMTQVDKVKAKLKILDNLQMKQ